MPKFSKVITQKIFFFSRIYSEVNQVIYSFILPINLPSFKAVAPTVFEILLTREKCSKLQRAITHELFFKIYLKVNQVVYSSISVDSSGFKALVLIFFSYFADKISAIFFQRTITQERDIILLRKKYVSAIFFFFFFFFFFMMNPFKNFQNSSMHGSKVMLCIKKVWRTDERTDWRTNAPQAICPYNFFQAGGIKSISIPAANPSVVLHIGSSPPQQPPFPSPHPPDGRTDGRTNAPEAICSSNCFEVGGIKRIPIPAANPRVVLHIGGSLPPPPPAPAPSSS